MNKSDHQSEGIKMRPDYVKIIFIGIPLTFLFWFAAFMSVASITHDADISTWVSLLFTTLFIPFYLIISKKYAKKLRVEISSENDNSSKSTNKTISTESGIIALVSIIILVAIMAVCEIFFSIEGKKAYRFAIIPLAIVMTLADRYFRKRT